MGEWKMEQEAAYLKRIYDFISSLLASPSLENEDDSYYISRFRLISLLEYEVVQKAIAILPHIWRINTNSWLKDICVAANKNRYLDITNALNKYIILLKKENTSLTDNILGNNIEFPMKVNYEFWFKEQEEFSWEISLWKSGRIRTIKVNLPKIPECIVDLPGFNLLHRFELQEKDHIDYKGFVLFNNNQLGQVSAEYDNIGLSCKQCRSYKDIEEEFASFFYDLLYKKLADYDELFSNLKDKKLDINKYKTLMKILALIYNAFKSEGISISYWGIYCFPLFRTEHNPDEIKGIRSEATNSAIIVIGNEKTSVDEEVLSFATRYFSLQDAIPDWTKKAKNDVYPHALRSAVAAIMGRNMSHNIGSHVLARLANAELASCVKGQNPEQIAKIICVNDKDDKEVKNRSNNCIKSIIGLSEWSNNMQIFLRYLQQRQDFIATISTEWPLWTDSVYFLRDAMQWFLQQKHLLDYIAASEDLVSHSYDNPPAGNDIRFHVFICCENCWENSVKRYESLEERYTSLKDKPDNFIVLYTKKDSEELLLKRDVLVGIPGGIIGYQAFYVMIENIIRNAAKHSYKKSAADHLDVVIEILYDPDEKIGIEKNGRKYGAFLFRIYDNVSYIRDDIDIRKDGILLWAGNKEKGMNDRLGDSLIDESAKLKKESWGLAEIKICAAYLRGLEIDRLGSNASAICGKPAYSLSQLAQSELGSSAIIRAVKSPLGTLGYEFFVLKPRLIGIHCKNEE